MTIKKYFDNDELNWIIKLKENNRYEEARILIEEYYSKYPYDKVGISNYIYSLLQFEEFEKAEEILNSIFFEDTPTKLKEDLIKAKVKLLFCTGKYEECLELATNYKEIINSHTLMLILKKKLNILNELDYYSVDSYLPNQAVNYNEETAINHIISHHLEDNTYDGRNQFNNNFDVEKVYRKIRSLLPNSTRNYSLYTENIYTFKYPNSGKENGKKANYIKVVTFYNTNEIITMYPYLNKEHCTYIDITPKVEYEETEKVKRISQIDKFNRRYSLF